MSADKLKSDIPDKVIESLARSILPSNRAYFESEEVQKEFAEWKEKNLMNQVAAENEISNYHERVSWV